MGGTVLKFILGVLLLSLFALQGFAQDKAALLAAAGCGPDNMQFEVKIDKHEVYEVQPKPGLALVYMFEEEKQDPGSLPVLAATIRIGVDGQWIGANHGKSHLIFAVTPGQHNLCANWQSSLKKLSALASAASLTAEPGKFYYFITKVDEREHDKPSVRLEPVDPAEAKLLLASTSLSNSRPKK